MTRSHFPRPPVRRSGSPIYPCEFGGDLCERRRPLTHGCVENRLSFVTVHLHALQVDFDEIFRRAAGHRPPSIEDLPFCQRRAGRIDGREVWHHTIWTHRHQSPRGCHTRTGWRVRQDLLRPPVGRNAGRELPAYRPLLLDLRASTFTTSRQTRCQTLVTAFVVGVTPFRPFKPLRTTSPAKSVNDQCSPLSRSAT